MISSKISFSVDVLIDPSSGLPCIEPADLYDMLLAQCRAEGEHIAVKGMSDAPVQNDVYTADRAVETITIPLLEERLQLKKIRQKTGEIHIHKHIEEYISESNVDVNIDLIIIDIDAEENVAKSCICFEEGRIIINLKPINQSSLAHGETPSIQDSADLPISFSLYEDLLEIERKIDIGNIISIKKVTNKSMINTKDILHKEEIDVKVVGDVSITYG